MPEAAATTHVLMSNELVLNQRERSKVWQCRYMVDGVWQRATTKQRGLGKGVVHPEFAHGGRQRLRTDPGPPSLPPPQPGTRIRYVDIPSDSDDDLEHDGARMHDAFAQIGGTRASTVKADSPNPLMHRTESADYGIWIQGEMRLVLDDSEVLLKVGSVVVQRDTNHASANRPGAPGRMLFVLVDGR
jgi:hypothetical protein